MPNIRVDVGFKIKDGSEIKFRSPVDCSAVTGLIVYYPTEDGSIVSNTFAFADAHGNNVGNITNLFAENVVVKVILDVTTGMAFVQNADTNAYLEAQLASKAPAGYGYGEALTYISATDTDGTNLENYLDTNFVKSENSQKVFRFSDFASYPDCSLSNLGGFADLHVANAAAAILTGYFYNANGGISMATKQKVHGVWYDWVDCSPSAFAPAGYGLGSQGAKLISGEALSNHRASGWYRYHSDVPDNPVGGYGGNMLVIASDLHIIQIAYVYATNNDMLHGCVAKRIITPNVNVDEWEWVNPPMTLGEEYRTTERWNGKAVYTVLIGIGALPNSTSIDVSHGYGVTVPIRCECILDDSATIPYNSWGSSVEVTMTRSSIVMTANFDASGSTAKAWLWYTKD
jgi:hypothetical protein